VQAAAVFYEKACGGGYAWGCQNLGWLASRGQGVEKDDARADRLFEHACDAGLADGCVALAGRLKQSGATNPDPAVDLRVVSLLERACNAGNAPSCAQLSQLYRSGQGVERNEALARQLDEQACRAGHIPSCPRVSP
jgi:hypothetical protein